MVFIGFNDGLIRLLVVVYCMFLYNILNFSYPGGGKLKGGFKGVT